MPDFVTLLVEDDAFQREAFADLLKDEGFEVIECTTAEAAELIIASTGAELQALITDQHLAGAMSGAQLAQYARRRHPRYGTSSLCPARPWSLYRSTPRSYKSPSLPRSCSKQSAIEKRAGLAPDREHTAIWNAGSGTPSNPIAPQKFHAFERELAGVVALALQKVSHSLASRLLF